MPRHFIDSDATSNGGVETNKLAKTNSSGRVGDSEKLQGKTPTDFDNKYTQTAFSTVASPSKSSVVAGAKGDTLTISGGTGITVSTDPSTKTLTITATGGTIPANHGSAHTSTGADPIPNVVSGGASGLITGADKLKLDGVATGAEVNQNAFTNVKVGATTLTAGTKTDQFELIAGTNITLTPSGSSKQITIATTANKVASSATNGNIKIENIETKVFDDTTINGQISSINSSIGSLNGRVLLPTPQINNSTRATDTMATTSITSNVTAMVASTTANTYYQLHDGNTPAKYVAKDFTLSKKTNVYFIMNVALNVGNASATGYIDIFVKNGLNWTDTTVWQTVGSGLWTFNTYMSWVSVCVQDVCAELPAGTYKAWGVARFDNAGCNVRCASGTITMIPFGVTGT